MAATLTFSRKCASRRLLRRYAAGGFTSFTIRVTAAFSSARRCY
jgi:hypothetical protein